MEKIRKFGSTYCDLPTMIWNVTILWRPLTINIDKRYKKRIPIIFYVIATVLTVSCYYVYLVSMLWFVFVKCTETGDTTAAMIVLSLGVSSQIGSSKLICMFFNRKEIQNLVEAYLYCSSMVNTKSRFAKNIHTTLGYVKKRAIAYWMVIVCNGIIYIVKPIVLPGRRLMEDSFVFYGLEPMYESPNYEIAFCLSAFGVIYSCYLPATITAFLIIIAGYTEAQILALSEEIKCLRGDAEEYFRLNKNNIKPIIIVNENKYKESVINEFIQKQLIVIIKKHTINIELLRQVESVFKGAIAIQFVLLTIALIAELLGGLEKTYIEMPFALMQVAMDCVVGQKVIDASIVFENAVYNSKWEMLESTNMKTILLILRNSQKTLRLSAGGLTMLSYASLKDILKSIYSTYTTLHHVVK